MTDSESEGPDEDAGDVSVGERVMLLNPQGTGQDYEAIVTFIHTPGTVNALYRPDGDGSFGSRTQQGTYVIATGLDRQVPPVTRNTHAFRRGWGEE